MKLVELCCGTGAFSHAFRGYTTTVFANDILQSSKKTFDLNNADVDGLVCKDIHELDVSEIPEHDILTCGFSCQGFSIAGLRKGFDDERSNVFWKAMEIVRHHKPRFVIFENVKNLRTHDNGESFRRIVREIEEAGYLHKSEILITHEISGIPQHRERMYIVCFREPNDYELFDFSHEKVCVKPITEFLQSYVPQRYYYTPRSSIFDKLQDSVTEHVDTGKIYQYRRYYVREAKKSLCPTLTANMGTGGHNVPIIMDDSGIRKLTPRECFNLQGFPSDYKLPLDLADSKLYSLAGNAVSIPVVELIANKLAEIVKG